MFKIGQKIVCVKPDKDGDLIKGEIYTIKEFCYGGQGVHLMEVSPSGNYISGFWLHRFRPIDNEWAEKVLHELLEEIKVDEMEYA